MSITTTNYANYTNLINTCHSRKNVLSMFKVNRSAQQKIREIREIRGREKNMRTSESWTIIIIIQVSHLGCPICCTPFWYGQSLMRPGTWASRPRQQVILRPRITRITRMAGTWASRPRQQVILRPRITRITRMAGTWASRPRCRKP